MPNYPNFEAVEGADGVETVTDWILIDQARISAFADATDDHQWIHVDAARAADGPFGATIAHGYLLLSFLPRFLEDVVQFDGSVMAINYGLNRVRFIQPVVVDSRVRARSRIASVERVAQGARITIAVVIEVEGSEKPAVVLETIALFVLPAQAT